MLNYATSTASMTITATSGLHDVGAVLMRVLPVRNEATLLLMCAGGQE